MCLDSRLSNLFGFDEAKVAARHFCHSRFSKAASRPKPDSGTGGPQSCRWRPQPNGQKETFASGSFTAIIIVMKRSSVINKNWHCAIIVDVEAKLSRPLPEYEREFITSHGRSLRTRPFFHECRFNK